MTKATKPKELHNVKHQPSHQKGFVNVIQIGREEMLTVFVTTGQGDTYRQVKLLGERDPSFDPSATEDSFQVE